MLQNIGRTGNYVVVLMQSLPTNTEANNRNESQALIGYELMIRPCGANYKLPCLETKFLDIVHYTGENLVRNGPFATKTKPRDYSEVTRRCEAPRAQDYQVGTTASALRGPFSLLASANVFEITGRRSFQIENIVFCKRPSRPSYR